MPVTAPVSANDRTYAAPKTCAIAICLDGCEPAYLDEAIARGLMPTLKRIRETGTDRRAHSVIPSFTNRWTPPVAIGCWATIQSRKRLSGFIGSYFEAGDVLTARFHAASSARVRSTDRRRIDWEQNCWHPVAPPAVR